MPAVKKENELYISRIYDAPVKLVWEAWTDSNKVAKWWGPRGFTITTHSKDLRAGGHWAYTMHGPDGVNYENKTLYHEVEKYSKLVYDHGGNDDRPPLFRVTVTFKEVKNKTHMEMTMALATPEAAREIAKFIKQASGNSTWDRLAEYLGSEEGKNKFVINRSFNAPIAKVFEMWTNVDHLKRWLPPVGFTAEFMHSEVRVGGYNFYKMSNGSVTLFGKSTYLEINPVTKLSYKQIFTDENGNVSRHPMAPLFPETMVSTIEFCEEGPNETRVTVTTEPTGPVTKEELEFFLIARTGMTMGWTGSFDKLEEDLAKS